jgi:hypothetical protein
LEERRISAKSIAEQLGISHERVGSIIHEDLDMLVACFLPGRAKDLSAPLYRHCFREMQYFLHNYTPLKLVKSLPKVVSSIKDSNSKCCLHYSYGVFLLTSKKAVLLM